MRALIVATSNTTPEMKSEIAAGERHRVDYLELSDRVGARYVDYCHLRNGRHFLPRLEARLGLDLRHAVHVWRLARSQRPDVVFSLSERVGIPLSYLLPASVLHVVQTHHLLSPRKLQVLRMLGVPAKWGALFVYTHAERAALQQVLRLPEPRIQRLPEKVDSKYWSPDRCFPDFGHGYLMSAGLSCRDYPTLMRALHSTSGIEAHLFLGSSWITARPALDWIAPPLATTIHPSVHPRELRDRYRASRLVVVPVRSTTQWSAGANAALEAQAVGKPVVATNTPGMPDVVLHGETGLLVEPGDPKALAEAIRELWHDPKRCASLGRQARDWVEANFSLDAWLDRAAEILTTGISPRPRSTERAHELSG